MKTSRSGHASGFGMPTHHHHREAGDTLLEVLIAIVVIAVGAVALVGALTTSITASVTYRTLATLDTVLKNFAETVKYDVQLDPTSTSIFTNCASPSTYQLVSEYPTSAIPGAGVSLFGSGLPSGSASVQIGGTAIPTTVTNGTATVTLPSMPAAPPARPIADGVLTAGIATLVSSTHSANFTLADIGSAVSDGGVDIPNGTTITGVTNSFTVTLSNSAVGSATNDQVNIGNGAWPVFISDPPTAPPLLSPTSFTVTPTLTALSSASGPVGTTVSVGASGFLANATLSVTIGGVTAVTTPLTVMTALNGSASFSFTIPSGSVGPAVVVSDGTNSSTTNFVVTSAGPAGPAGPTVAPPASAIAGYTVGISSIAYWDDSVTPPVFDSTCNSSNGYGSGIQLITLQATATNQVSDTLNLVVTDPAFRPAITVSVSNVVNPVIVNPALPSPPTNGAFTFTATVTGTNTLGNPGGPVNWAFTTSSGSPSCVPTALAPVTGNAYTSYATYNCSGVQSGIYQVTATYGGTSNYSSTAGYGSVSLKEPPSSMGVTGPASVGPGALLQFTATVTGGGGVTPTGTIVWVFSPTSPGSPAPSCLPSPLTAGANNKATATCTVASAAASGTYQVTGTYSGDTNFIVNSAVSNAVPVT